MTRREAVLRLREWYEAFANFEKGNERTVKEFLEIEDLIHSMDAELTLVKKERDDLRKGMEAATSLLDEYAQTSPRWISVEERLPDAHADGSVDAVLVTDGEFIHMAYYVPGQWIFCESGEMKEPMWNTVTHWMPLPKAPKEET